jgi:2-polyprenyl-3-methyl-5-hydroxy-6-metoxy-1,4-benzoquinol methylase
MKRTKDSMMKYLGPLKSCIICDGKKFETWAKFDYLEAKRCKKCGMISVNPHLTKEGLELYYDGYYEERLNEGILFEQRWKVYEIDRKWITKFIDQGKVLDVGCSGGQFLSTFNSKKWDRYGVEIEKTAAEYAKRKYGIPVTVGNLVDISFRKKFDLVMMRGVIEHFSDPISTLKKCAEIIKPGGYLFITATPAGNSFAFYIYREKWRMFTPPGHLHFFTVDLLSRVLKRYGLSLLDHHYQYEETPYANTKEDFDKMRKDIILAYLRKYDKIKESPPFPGSMITAVWKKM